MRDMPCQRPVLCPIKKGLCSCHAGIMSITEMPTMLQGSPIEWAAAMAARLPTAQTHGDGELGHPGKGLGGGSWGPTKFTGTFDVPDVPEHALLDNDDGPSAMASPFMDVLETRGSDARVTDPRGLGQSPSPGQAGAAAAGAAAAADQRRLAMDPGAALRAGSSGETPSLASEASGGSWHEEGGWRRAGERAAPAAASVRDTEAHAPGEGALAAYRCMIVMEFCEAGTLWQALQHGLLHEGRSRTPRLRPLLEVALDVAEALGHLHSRRLVHRDITSGNVLLTARSSSAGGSTGGRAERMHAKAR